MADTRKRSALRSVHSPISGCLSLLLAATAACSSTKSPADLSGPECEAQKTRLLDLNAGLPDESTTTPVHVALPTAGLLGTIGQGPVLELAESGALLDGQALPGDSVESIAVALAQALKGREQETLYVAAAFDLDMTLLYRFLQGVPKRQTLKLVFTSASADVAPPNDDVTYEQAVRVFNEASPSKREQLAEQAFEAYSSCNALNDAVHQVHGTPLAERWRRLKPKVQQSLAQCECGELNAPALEFLLVAEQRANSGTMGALSANFLRDPRCAATMPLATTQQLLKEIEKFEEEFSGEWEEDALRFEKVVTEERLFNYLCVALPGETLAFLEKEYAELYWKVPGKSECQTWRFEPQSRGAPMGTWRRVSQNSSEPELAFHYRQAAEELRLFGPATAATSATMSGPWTCDQDLHMKGATPESIVLEQGGWFLSKAECDKAPASAALKGCAAELAAANDPAAAVAAMTANAAVAGAQTTTAPTTPGTPGTHP